MTRTLDHGILNTPIGSRARGGSIDAQIDQWKREQRREERLAAAEVFRTVRANKKRVRDLLARIGDHRVLVLAKPMGARKPTSARSALYSAAMSNLPKWIAALEREKFPGGCATCWAPLGECDHSDDEWFGPA